MRLMKSLPLAMRASMFEDLLAGRRLELPWLSGRVVRVGRDRGIPTPANRMVDLTLKLHVMGANAGGANITNVIGSGVPAP